MCSVLALLGFFLPLEKKVSHFYISISNESWDRFLQFIPIPFSFVAFFITDMLLSYSSSPEFDVSELETLFSATVPKSSTGGKAGSRRYSTGSKTEKVHLVMSN